MLPATPVEAKLAPNGPFVPLTKPAAESKANPFGGLCAYSDSNSDNSDDNGQDKS